MGSRTTAQRIPGGAEPAARLRLFSASAVALLLAGGCAAPLPAAGDREPAPIPPPVQTPPPVPRPAPGEPVETWSVSVEGVPIRELLFALARDAGVNIAELLTSGTRNV